MKPERGDYQALLESLADGAPVDWAALDDSAATSTERRRYRNLRLVARVAELHRTLIPDEDLSASPALGPAGLADTDPAAWGHLSIVSPLTSGAFGRIYRAHDSRLNRDVALKLLRGDIALFRPIERLLTEARTLAKVRHPNVVTVHGADVRDGRAGLWMEFVDGQTLESWVSAHGVMGAGEVTAVGIDLCRALAAVHSAGLVHGDVKAHNVMREQGGRIVLMDFGAGRAQGADVAGLSGTPMYLAPEVLAGEPPTPQSDLYSLGVLLFHLLTGKYPYSGSDLEGLRSAHANSARTWLRDARPDLPETLVQAVERALDADPARRSGSAGAMEAALRGSITAPAKFRLHPGLLTVAAALVCLVIGLIVWSWTVASNRGTVLARIRTVAVLPMVDATSGAIPAQFAESLTEEVIEALGQVHVLTVKSGASIGSTAGKSDKEIARALDVDALLRTTLSTAGESDRALLKVRARLVAAGTQGIVWSQEIGRPRGDSLALAGAIAGAVTRAVKVMATPAESARLTAGHQTTPAAEEAYLLGHSHLDQYGSGSADLALKSFQRALRLDPGHPSAHAGAAQALIALGMNGAIPHAQARAAALSEIRQALDLDPDLAQAHATLAHIHFVYDWDWEGADREFRLSLDLNPSSSYARAYYANYLASQGRFDESLSQAETAKRLDPESGAAVRNFALFEYYKRDFAAAERALQQAEALEPNNASVPLLEGRFAEARRQFSDALDNTRRALELSRGGGVPLRVQEVRLEALAGQHEEALQALADLQHEAAARRTRVSPRDLGYIHLAFGDEAKALDFFDDAVAERDPSVVWLAVDPRLDALHGSPRFTALLRTIGLRLASPNMR